MEPHPYFLETHWSSTCQRHSTASVYDFPMKTFPRPTYMGQDCRTRQIILLGVVLCQWQISTRRTDIPAPWSFKLWDKLYTVSQSFPSKADLQSHTVVTRLFPVSCHRYQVFLLGRPAKVIPLYLKSCLGVFCYFFNWQYYISWVFYWHF